jgi:hypothetical protein
MSEDDPEVWLARNKRRGAWRLFAIGAVLSAAGLVWAIGYWNHGVSPGTPISYVRVVSVLVIGIGAGMLCAGSWALLRSRSPAQ